MTDLVEDAKAPPRLFEHCCRVFEAMRVDAVSTTLTDGGEARHALVWEGHSTKLFRELELPTPYYTKVFRQLKAMGCVMQLGRGGGSAVSRWELIDDPTIDAFDDSENKRRSAPTRIGNVEQRVVDLNTRVQDLEETVETLVELLRDHLEEPERKTA